MNTFTDGPVVATYHEADTTSTTSGKTITLTSDQLPMHCWETFEVVRNQEQFLALACEGDVEVASAGSIEKLLELCCKDYRTLNEI